MSKLKNLALLIISIIAVMLIGISISYAADLEDESQTKDWVPNSAYVLYTKGEGTEISVSQPFISIFTNPKRFSVLYIYSFLKGLLMSTRNGCISTSIFWKRKL